ncbi:glutaredoxin family protein [Blastococcus sp. Marseille-P5729]|uniref:glutaredoxin family protein n=1 Tax=Blastococcus sp. Marseille-P5729 TaxID=2086582 RepID=UPI000D0F7715|nr:glutaredoxin family protein [Blastococcus sp. Marseille-P5729]
MSIDVVLMSRAGCHLCEIARDDLAQILPDYGLSARVVDIDTDAELVAEYGERVPVLLLDGDEHAHFRIDETALRRALAARGAC